MERRGDLTPRELRVIAAQIVDAYSWFRPSPEPAEFLFLMRLLARCGSDMKLIITATSLAAEMRLTSRQLRTYAKTLEIAGFLKRRRVRARATKYDLSSVMEKLHPTSRTL